MKELEQLMDLVGVNASEVIYALPSAGIVSLEEPSTALAKF